MKILLDNLTHALMITLFVFVMMLLVDYFNVVSKGKLSFLIKGKRWRQYGIASFLGSTPGCLGAYLNVSFYVHGLISFGAIVGGMIATSGDEAFVMLTLFPKKAFLLFILLFFLGILLAWITDKIVTWLQLKTCRECKLQVVHTEEYCDCFKKEELAGYFLHISFYRAVLLIIGLIFLFLFIQGVIGPPNWDWKRVTMVSLVAIATVVLGSTPEHYLKEHIWHHIVRKHLGKVFLWTFFALLFVNVGLKFFDFNSFISDHIFIVLLFAVLIGIIPESGPHMVIVMLFASGAVPFSILAASSIVQDGHGMLPMLSFSVKDSVIIKIFNVAYGLVIGSVLLAMGW